MIFEENIIEEIENGTFLDKFIETRGESPLPAAVAAQFAKVSQTEDEILDLEALEESLRNPK